MIDNDIGKRIKELRDKRKLSQSELADKMNSQFTTNLNKGRVSKWENGLGEPRLDTTRHLAIFFHVSLGYLLGLEQNESTTSTFGTGGTADIITIAAHHDGENWTDEELDEIERFKSFVRSKRKIKE